MTRPSVAVVGGGVAGLTAAYLLRSGHDTTLYDAASRLGGHADTRRVRTPDGTDLPLDTGFLVHNRRTYPYLTRLFADLDVPTAPSEMSMSFSCRGCGLAYAGGKRGKGLLPAGGWAVGARYGRMLAEVPRFHHAARALLAGRDVPGLGEGFGDGFGDGDLTLGAMLEAGRFSTYFAEHHVIPLVGAVWSAGATDVRDYPARYLFRFLHHHGLLSARSTHRWRHVVGGSRRYVERIARTLPAPQAGVPVRAVHRHADGVSVTAEDGTTRQFDRVVIATHADQALALLADPTAAERRVLGAFGYARNTMTLHTDPGRLPARERLRASWNHTQSSCRGDRRVAVSYHLNRLMGLSEPLDYVVTLNGEADVDGSAVLERADYSHPVYNPAALAAQRELPGLTDGRTAYAGSYHGWGFHEDACRSAVRAAEAFGVRW